MSTSANTSPDANRTKRRREDNGGARAKQHRSTPSECVARSSSPGSSSNHVIIMHHEEDEVWDTEDDTSQLDISISSSDESTTSTPGYKRAMSEPSLSKQEVVELIKKEGLQAHKLIPEATLRAASILILADSKLQDWPLTDKKCVVYVKEDWSIKDWVDAIRSNWITIRVPTVVLYLKRIKDWKSLPPIKNAIQSIYRAIRLRDEECRPFVCNLLPIVGTAPVLGMRVQMLNPIIMKAVESVHRIMGKCHLMDIHGHFTGAQGGGGLPPPTSISRWMASSSIWAVYCSGRSCSGKEG